ncbi:MAG TPA: hypothetical protein VHC70_08035, partial [Phycisphaerales bacterium]|nr:hypothetical protein [Phycisphaerales bacterium]
MNRYSGRNGVAMAACLGVLACAGLARAQTDTQIPLNYNFHGMAHGPEAVSGATGANSDAILFRSIADRGLVWDVGNPDAFGTNPLVGYTGITYGLFNTLGYGATTAGNAAPNGLDCVHLGNRVYFRGQETSANPGTTTGVAAPWAPIFDLATLSSDGATATATTSSPHGLSVGQLIAIVGATPSAFSGTFTVASIPNSTTFTFACTASGTAGGSMFCNSTSTPIVSALSGSGSTVTATTVVAHGFAVGNTVNISGSSIPGYNGQYTLASVAATSFTYSSPTTGTPTGTEIICATCLHDAVDQTTVLQTPLTVDGTTQIGVLYHATNSGSMLAQFDAVLTFHDGSGDTNVTARLSAPDWFGAQIDPPIISRFVSSQKRMTFSDGFNTYNTFQGVQNNDSAALQNFSTTNAGPNLNVIEAVVSVQKILDAGINVSGKQLTKITFRNAFFNPLQVTALSFSGGVGTATMAANSTFIVGEPIVISGVSPASYNGTYKVDALVGTTQIRFLAPGAADGTGTAQRYANGLPVSNVTMNGTIATATTASPHGFAVGDRVTMTGIGNTLTTAGYAGALGTYDISSVPSSTTFTYPCITTGVTTTSAHMQITGVGVGRGYAVYAATVRTNSTVVTCCDNATGACAIAYNICNGAATQGPGSACQPTTCPAIAQCCNNNTGACTLIYGGACPSGTLQGGSGTSCAPGSNPCPPSGACCSGTANQSCALSLAVACLGLYVGDNTTCSPNNPCLPSDECGSTDLVAMLGAQSGDTTGSTPSAAFTITGSGSCTQTSFNTGVHNDVFWLFTAPATTTYVIDLCGSGFDTVLTINSGCPVTQANLLD